MESQVLLELKDIKKSFNSVKALDGINLTIREGEVTALVGENGAGKSTLMKIISGIYQKDSGHIFYKGEEVNFLSPKEAIERHISIIHQELNLCNNLSVADNIFIGHEIVSTPLKILNKKKTEAKAKEILDYLNVDIDPKELVSNLSIAQKQMVEIAKSCALEANILIMDEPSSSLTDKEISALFTLIENLKSKNKSIVYISHKLSEVMHVSDNIVVIRDGKYIGELDPSKCNEDEIISMMVGRKMEDVYPKRHYERSENVALEVSNLSSSVSGVKDVSFKLYQGEILGIYGLVGSGRTEAMKTIYGAYPKTSGTTKINGKEVNIKNPNEAIKNGIAYLTENRKEEGLCLDLSVMDNFYSGRIREKVLGIINFKNISAKCRDYIQRIKIKTTGTNQIIKKLSGGNQQKVIISKWLDTNPKILIFDEPTRGIDVGAKFEIYSLINDLSKNGLSIIIVSSELPEILGTSDRVLIMREGKSVAIIDKTEATQERVAFYATGGTKGE